MKKVLVTGGAGYKGCVLVPKLLAAGHEVVVYDLMLFGSAGLTPHPRLTVVTGDIRDTAKYAAALKGCDAVIHMAAISNDPSFDLDPSLSRTMNYECFEPLMQATAAAGTVERFINVSSSSVYGVSDAPEVTEEHPLVPLTDYNKYKGLCEPIAFKYQSPKLTVVTFRPATVCGYSPRMRFDLTVNILTNHAYHRGVITVFGGDQQRPNIHIEDVTDLYAAALTMPKEKLAGQIFNAGYQNQTVNELAEITKKIVGEEFPERPPIRIERTTTNDPRSYRITSRKIEQILGWRPKRTIEDAVRDLCRAFKAGKFPGNTLTDESFVNVKSVKRLGLK
ncbi:UDP-glucose 4-epimerase [Verrucomicrobiota bacterium]|nr:UDP-glucose 4-epimerase [Verrucomicrobiota bacterium]